jgi:hypothetical protein
MRDSFFVFNILPILLKFKIENKNKLLNKTNSSLSIVKGGEYLGFTTGMSRYKKEIRNMIYLPSFQISVLIGILLSDASLVKASTKRADKSKLNPILAFGQSFDKFNYF